MAGINRVSAAWCVLTVVLLASCGGGPSVPAGAAGPGLSGATAGLPAFPGNRLPSNLIVDSGMASDCELGGPGVTPLGDAVLFAPGTGQAAYAEIEFDATGGPQPTASFLFEGSRTTGAWVGVADYTTGRWEFHGPFAGTDVVRIDLTGGDNYVSPGQSTWVVVLAPAGEQVLLRALTFGAVQANNQLPTASFAIQVDNPDAPQSVLVFGSASHDPDGTIMEWDWDWDGDGVYDRFDNGGNDSHLYPGLGSSITLRVVDDQLATATLTLPVHYNEQPVAQLTSPTPVADPQAVVTLDASGSSDPDGTIAHYAWDLDDNGVFGEAGAEAAAADQPTTTVTLNSEPGLQSVSVEVTDDGGRTATARLTLTVRGWRITTVDTTNGTLFPSLAVVNGLPAIVYQNNPVGTLDYATNAQVDGLGAWTITRSIYTGDPYRPQLVEAAGFPALAVADSANQRVWFSHSDQADGSANWHSLQVDPAITVDGMADLTLTATGLGVSFYDATAMQLRYAYTAVQDGGGGWTSLAIDSTGDDTGRYNSLCLINGNPAIAYVDSTTGGIRYAWSTEPDGSSNWDDVAVVASGTDVNFGDLAEISGAPALCVSDTPNCLYGYSTIIDGSSGWSTLNPDPAFSTAPGSRLFAYQGHPCIVYPALLLSGGIEFGRSSTPNGSSGWTSEQVDAQGMTPSALVVAGRPTIAYAGSFPVSGIFYAVLFE